MMKMLRINRFKLFLVVGILFISLPQPRGFAGYIPINDISHLELVFLEQPELLDRFHDNLLMVLLERDKQQKYSSSVVLPEYDVDMDLGIAFVNLLISNAWARNTGSVCNYGGWPSLIYRSGECLPPWNKTVKKSRVIKSLGPTYSGRYSCGKNDMFRCNPLIFGTVSPPGINYRYPDHNMGICIKLQHQNPASVMSRCVKAASRKKNRSTHIINLKKDPYLLLDYLKLASENIRYCKMKGSDLSYCQGLLEMTKLVAVNAVCCVRDYKKEREDLGQARDFATAHASIEEILDKYRAKHPDNKRPKQAQTTTQAKGAYSEYANSYKVDQMIKRINRNASRCLEDSCKGKYRKKRGKPKAKALGWCLRYVKYGLKGSKKNGFVTYKTGGAKAKNYGSILRSLGFKNIMTKIKNQDPRNAPRGAIIIYRNTAQPKKAGHIEVKMDHGRKSRFGSDFVRNSPISEYAKRKVIGIYVK